MGNKPDRDKHTSQARPIEETEGGGVAVDLPPKPAWTFDLEDLAPAARALRPQTSVRGRRGDPRILVHAGDPLVGYAPRDVSAEIRNAMDSASGASQGRVLRVDFAAGLVTVELSLGGY